MADKPHLNLIVTGHIDNGKSTTMGHFLMDLGVVDERTIAAHGAESEKTGKGDTFKYAWVMDNIKDERERGITIDLAFQKFESPKYFFTLIDAPGHRDFIKNMITGAAQMDGGILVVNAADGPMPQTREHILLARQVGVPNIVVFMNKADLVDDEEMLELVDMEVRELLSSYEYDGDNTPIITGSALKALEGTDEAKAQIMELMAAVDSYIPTPARDVDLPFLMPVEDVFSITGRGTVATGSIERGVINTGDPVDIVGLMKEGEKNLTSVITGVEMFRKILDRGEAGDNAGLLLRGIDKADIKRGQVIVKPGSITPHT